MCRYYYQFKMKSLELLQKKFYLLLLMNILLVKYLSEIRCDTNLLKMLVSLSKIVMLMNELWCKCKFCSWYCYYVSSWLVLVFFRTSFFLVCFNTKHKFCCITEFWVYSIHLVSYLFLIIQQVFFVWQLVHCKSVRMQTFIYWCKYGYMQVHIYSVSFYNYCYDRFWFC